MHIATRGLGTIAAGFVLLAGIAACGSSSSTTSDPLASLTAKQIAVKARADMQALSNYRIAGAVTQSGKSVSVDLNIVPGKGCQGTIQESGLGTLGLTYVGTKTWVKASAAFWSASAHVPAALASQMGGKYIPIPASQSSAVGGQMCGGSPFTASSNDGKLKKGGIVTLNGQRVLILIDADQSRGYVTDTAKPLFVRITGSKSSDGYATVTTSSTPVVISPPPASEVFMLPAA
jgi:hypothetical protein